MDNLNNIAQKVRDIEKNFKQEIEPIRSELWKYCYKLTGSPWDAEDLVQDTLLKSLSILAKIYQPINTKAYIFKIATNIWIDQKRREKFVMNELHENISADTHTPSDFQLIENIDTLLTYLTAHQYVAFILIEAFQFKGKEVANMLGSTEGAVYTNLSRARSILKQVEDKGFEKKVNISTLSTDHTLEIFLEGFRKKDPDLIASVLSKDIETDITHAGIEMGIDETKNNSLKDWKEIVDSQHIIVADYKELWGKPIIVELEMKEDGYLYLNNLHFVKTTENEISYWKFYCFSWDLMNLAANELDVKLNAKYLYNVF